MLRAAFYSCLLHGIIFLFCFFGLPHFQKEKIDLMRPIPIEVMTVAEETMAPKPTITPVKGEPHPDDKKPLPEPEPEKPTPPPAPMPEPEPEPVLIPEPTPPSDVPQPEGKQEPKPEPAPTPPVEPVPPPEPSPKPAIKEAAPEPQPKPEPPKPKKPEIPKKLPKTKEKKPENKKEDSFDSLLKNLEDSKDKNDNTTDQLQDPHAKASAKQTGKESDQLTISELDLLSTHFKKCWSMAAGAQDAENLSVQIRIWTNPDGTVKEAEIVDKRRLGSDPYYRIAAESALRAAKDPRCSKLPLSLKKYDLWKIMVLNFDPRFLLGG